MQAVPPRHQPVQIVQSTVQWGEPIPRPLPTGPSPDEGAGGPTGAGTDWMVDFGAAVNAGMAVQVLLRADMPHEFDLVGVVGVQATTDPAQSATALGDLLTAHAYSWGCDLVPVGTPTNNDGAAATAGYAAHGRAAAGDGERLTDDADAADPDDDLDRLAAAFGIAVPEALRRSPNAGLRGQADARGMATALWPATWGYFLTQLLAPEHDGSPVAAWRRFTLDTVRGRGPLPALRVGPQPYGVLPVTATRLWRTTRTGLVSVTASGASCTLLDTWSVDPATGPGPTTTQSLPRVTVTGRFANARLALGELDGLVRTFLLEPGAAGAAATLRPGPVVDGTGAADGGWQNSVSLPAPFAPAGAGLCAAVRPGGTLAVLRLVAAPRGQLLSAALGNRLRPDATVSGWLDVGGSAIAVQPTDRLLGAAASDATSTGTLDLYALVAETGRGLTCRVATAVDQRGVRWGAPVAVPVPAGTVLAATAALSDVDGDRRAELVVSMLAGNQQWLAVGRLARDGSIAGGWAGPWPVGPAVPAGTECLGFLPVRFGASPHAPPYSPPRLVHLLATASEPWLARTDSGAVPFVGRGDPDTDLLRILASDAVSGTVRLRRLMGMAYLLSLYRVAGLPVPADATQVLIARTSAALQAELGLPADDRRLQAMAYLDPPDAYAEPWVQDGELSDVDTLAANHLAWAAKAEPDQLHDRAAWPGGDSLLRRLVRHSTLQGWADVAMRIAPLSPPLREPELVDVPDLRDADPRPAGHTLTSWRYLSEPQGGRRLADEVRARLAGNDPAAADLAELRAALTHLATVPTAALHHLLGETLDLAGHRLDAWVTAVATQRLGELRATRPDGLHLGGYGFVEKLAPADSAPVTTGFVHAPSLAHATTAAVLRSGYLSHAGRPTAAGLAVDLSSARVRSALELLDGVRAGQSLGALLGYRFERALRDGGALARYLPAFRQLFPLTAGRLHDLPAATPVADVAARQVCDGLALVRTGAAGIAWGGTPAGSGVALPPAGSADHTALVGILATVTDALDAACDLATAESVFQAASGNPARVGAVLDALNRGEVPPPVPEVVRSARSGVVVNHRVLVTLTAPDPADPAILAWAASAGRPRALAEPRLDAWAARLLGDPARIRWRAVAGPTTRTYTVADLGLCPLDLVYADDLTPGSDLYATLVLHAAGGLAESQLILDRDPGWPADVVSVGEALTAAGAVRELFTASRPMTPTDLLPPGASAAPGPDALADRARDTASRLTTARNALRELFDLADPVTDRATLADLTGIPAADLAELTNLLDLPPSVDLAAAAAAVLAPDPDRPGELRSALLGLAAFGVRGAVPAPVPTTTSTPRRSRPPARSPPGWPPPAPPGPAARRSRPCSAPSSGRCRCSPLATRPRWPPRSPPAPPPATPAPPRPPAGSASSPTCATAWAASTGRCCSPRP
jgi:hypothetical protein